MKNLQHTDNICNVGWTCIHGSFSADDMREMLHLHPKGSFSPTFYASQNPNTPERLEQYLKDSDYFKVTDEMPMYFQFPRDNYGEKLLDKLFKENKKPVGWYFKYHFNLIKK